MVICLFESSNLLLGFVPESVGMLVFGVSLITLAIALRWFMARFEESVFTEDEPIRNVVDSGDALREVIERSMRVQAGANFRER